MSDRYWVGGAGTWDATTTTNWSASSGGAGGASAPTSIDNVIFDSLSNATLYTVTVGTNAVCNDLTAAGPLTGSVTFSLGGLARIDCRGSMTLPATNLTWTGSAGSIVNFSATTTGKTITTNGVNLTSTALTFNGVGGEWTLGSAFTSSAGITITNGTFNTGSYNITATVFSVNVVGTQTINLGSSTLTLSSTAPLTFSQIAGLTFNAGTSQINCSFGTSTVTLAGGGQTFYNVSFTGVTSGTTVITGANTFNDLTQTSRSATGQRFVTLGADQTVNGTLTLGTANTAIRRMAVQSDVVGTIRTITLNGTLATLADVDFKDIGVAGTVATPWTGTRLGNGLNNNNITFDAGKTVYFNFVTGANWSATCWALSSGGTPSVNNFPLAQDKAIIENTGLNTSAPVAIDNPWWIGEIDLSTRSNAMAFNNAAVAPRIYKNVTLSSAVTMTGTGVWNFVGQGTTQILDTNTATFVPPITIDSPSGTLQLAENTTCSGSLALTSGTLNLNNNTLTCTVFSSNNSNVRAIAFGTGKIVVTGNNAGIVVISNHFGFSYTGTSRIELSYSGSVGTRSIIPGVPNAIESTALNYYVIAGSDIVNITGNTGLNVYRTLDFTGFAGSMTGAHSAAIYRDLIFSTGMTVGVITSGISFPATSGIQQITTNNKTLDFPITQNGIGGTIQLQDNLTIGSTRAFTFTNGTFDLNGKILTTGTFSSAGAGVRLVAFGGGAIAVSGATYTVSGTNFSTSGSGIINMTSASSKTFAGGGFSYPTISQDGAGALTITGSNTFHTIANTVTPATITLPASTTTSIAGFDLVGTAGNLLTLNSSVSGTRATINNITGGRIGGDYLSYRDTNATPASTISAGTNSTSVSNNTGWLTTPVVFGATAESITFSDAQDGIRGQFANTTDAITLTDSDVSQIAFAPTTAESLTLADAQSTQVSFVITNAEALTLTNTQATQVSFVSTTAESVTFADVPDGFRGQFGSVSDSITLENTQASFAAFAPQVAELLALAELISIQSNLVGYTAETIVFTDAQTPSGWIKINNSQNPGWVSINNSQ